MKYITRAFLPLVLMAPCYAFTADPFIQTWYYNNGLAIYQLEITPSNAPGQTFHVAYTSPEGTGSSDMCHLNGPENFSCLGGEAGLLNKTLHAVKFTQPGGTFLYYDAGFMPHNDAILGRWYYQQVNSFGTTNYVIAVAKGEDENHFLVQGSMSDSNGNKCGFGSFDTYTSETNADGSKTLNHGKGVYDADILHFDPIHNQIDNANERQTLKISYCLNFTGAPVVFKKE